MAEVYEEGVDNFGGLEDIEADNTSIDEIDAENVNLIFLGIDESGSMWKFDSDMVKCLREFKDALINSKEADQILIARANFESTITVGGYKGIDKFDTGFQSGGSTLLYDVIVDGAKKLMDYRQYLKDEGERVKAVFSIFSDGEDNGSIHPYSEAKNAIEQLNQEEITTAFISFGGEATRVAKSLGFRNVLDVSSSASELRKAFDCLSKSVIESSKSVVADGDDFFKID